MYIFIMMLSFHTKRLAFYTVVYVLTKESSDYAANPMLGMHIYCMEGLRDTIL